MKIQNGFVKQKICEKTVLVRTNHKKGFCGIVELNDTAAVIWNCLEKGYTLQQCAEKIVAEYDTDYNTAFSAVEKVYNKMIENGIATEE